MIRAMSPPLAILARLGPAAAVLCLSGGQVLAAGERDQAIARMQGWTGLPARAVIAVTPEMAVALVSRGAPATSGRIEGVELQGEVLDEGYAAARGWRSMRLKVDIGCGDGGSTWARRMSVYPQHGQRGPAREAATPAGWVRPKPEAYLGQVVDALCAHAPPAVIAALPVDDAGPAHPPPMLRPALAPSPIPQTRPAGPSVQIAASPDAAEAQRMRDGPAQKLIASDPRLDFHVEPAVAGGRKVYRALVSGFADRLAAQRWCMALREAGGACFLR